MTASQILREESAWSLVKNLEGLTRRKWDSWTTQELIHTRHQPGKGNNGQHRIISQQEIIVLRYLIRLVAAGVTPVVAEPVARDLAEGRCGVLGGFAVVGSL